MQSPFQSPRVDRRGDGNVRDPVNVQMSDGICIEPAAADDLTATDSCSERRAVPPVSWRGPLRVRR